MGGVERFPDDQATFKGNTIHKNSYFPHVDSDQKFTKKYVR